MCTEGWSLKCFSLNPFIRLFTAPSRVSEDVKNTSRNSFDVNTFSLASLKQALITDLHRCCVIKVKRRRVINFLADFSSCSFWHILFLPYGGSLSCAEFIRNKNVKILIAAELWNSTAYSLARARFWIPGNFGKFHFQSTEFLCEAQQRERKFRWGKWIIRVLLCRCCRWILLCWWV